MNADTPNAVIEAANDTENPLWVNINGSVIVTNPPLIPYGNTRNRKVNGCAVFFLSFIKKMLIYHPLNSS